MNCLAQRKKFKGKKPVWEDPSDKELEQPTRIEEVSCDDGVAGDDASSSSSASDDDDDYELVAGEVRSKRIRLETKELRYKHLTNINNDRSYNGPVKQVQFHPTSKMALVALARGQVDLYEIDGERNRYIQNIKLPFSKGPFCSFKPDGSSIVISSENFRGNFFSYDMIKGEIKKYAVKVGKEQRDITDFRFDDDFMACRKEGSSEVLVLSARTYENAFSLKLNEPAKVVRFSKNNEIYIAGENARVYVWDTRKTSLCKHRFQDDGSIHTNSFDISNSAGFLSIGSDCGIVNSYNISDCMANKFPTPIRVYSNLKTPINLLEYNHSGELLLFGSSEQSGAIRMSHNLSGMIYRNFPLPGKDYGKLSSACFSPLSGYIALASSKGRAYLCRIPYYKSY
jgi:WD40 repeat protein